jgi:hypothetical protein
MEIKKIEGYYRLTTAKKARKIGDLILLAGSTITMISVSEMPHWVTYLSVALTFIGKAITSFFTDTVEENL